MEKVKYSKSEEPIVISKATSDRILKEDKPADIMALYWFYYYTAKWQGNNQAKSAINYVAKGLNWSEVKVRKNKKILEALGLIEQIKKTDEKTKKILGWYIKVNFIWSEKASLAKRHKVAKGTRWKPDTQIPLTNNKIPLTNNKNITKVIEPEAQYGREDINEVINFLKEKNNNMIDGSVKENRQYAKLLIDKVKKAYPEENTILQIKAIIQTALSDDFHAKNATTMKYLFYNTQKIIQTIKGRQERVLII